MAEMNQQFEQMNDKLSNHESFLKMLATRKTEKLVVCTPEHPQKFPGFVPSQAAISQMSIE